jgi:PAS domain-containing protein
VRRIVLDQTSGPAAVGTAAELPRIGDDGRDFSSEALDALPVGVLLVGRDGIIARVNRESERLFGYSSSELIGHSVDLLLPDAARGASPWLRQAATHRPYPTARHASGSPAARTAPRWRSRWR